MLVVVAMGIDTVGDDMEVSHGTAQLSPVF